MTDQDEWPQGDPRWFSEGDRALFLHELQHNGGDVKEALDAVRVSPLVALRAYKSDPAFKAQWDEAIEAANFVLEHHAVKRATKGNVRTTIDNQGNQIEVEDRPSDKMLTTLLKARNPSVYSEKMQITGADGGPVQVRDALIGSILELMAKKGDKDADKAPK